MLSPSPAYSPTFVDLQDQPALDAGAAITAGLLQRPASVAPKYFYDRLGSALFTAITALPEYYPTRCENDVFAANTQAIAGALHAHMPAGFAMVDIGAGDGAKAARWFASLQPTRYVAVDISVDYLKVAMLALQAQFPALPMTGIAQDFSQVLTLPPEIIPAAALMFYPGSSIGNFNPDDALRLLRDMHQACHGGALLIGADLRKPVPVLQAAYDDELGVTAAFNLNLLRHLNALIGSDFRVADWQHVALFNEADSRVEMHLQARRELHVRWPGGERHFAQGERLHTENSHKWAPAEFEALLRDAGWRHVKRYTDARGWFGVFLAMA
jgi:L-histidine Nalpha-methyltransferase